MSELSPSLLAGFEDIRRRVLPFAEARGYFTQRGRRLGRFVRVFLDTDVLIAGFATRGPCADVMRVVLTEYQLITGEVERPGYPASDAGYNETARLSQPIGWTADSQRATLITWAYASAR